ncbi:MAG: FtsW/RodA/SpoVE family cell cycle protein [Clostridia bacterium]|nr:FtsW/RodA/SpoVE family cell cycle protein [Clostridia bacterium]
MAPRQQVYTARPKARPAKEEDGAVSAPYKPQKAQAKRRKIQADEKAAGKKADSSRRTDAPRRAKEKEPAERKAPRGGAKKGEAKQATPPGRTNAQPEKKAKDAAKPARRAAAALRAPAGKPDTRAKRQEEAVYRDRRRSVSRGGDFGITMMALLTAVFEALGLLLTACRQTGTLDTRAVALLAAVVPLGLMTTLALPRVLPIDRLIMALTNFLCGVSVVILYTVSPERGVRQTCFYALGLAVMLAMGVLVSRCRHFKGLTLLSMLLGIVALALPLVLGEWQNGAKNWVTLPLVGSFQPSEMVKLSIVLTLAYYFSAHRTVFQMMPAILFAGACLVLLMLQRDLGTALIYYLTTLVLFYAACGNMPLTVLGLGGGVGAAVLGYKMFAHVKVRVAMWRNPWSDPLDKGHQIIQALLAIGSGGLFGVGLGQGTPDQIPAYYNDFIFAVICEQMGLIFELLVLAVYLLLIARGVSIAVRARRSFDLLLGCGVLALLGIQTFMIVAGVIKMIPLTGVTMPFLSYGGSSLLSCLAMVGVLNGIAERAQENLEEDILGA